MNDNIEFLKTVEIFSLLSEEELEMVINNFHFFTISENETLFSEGDTGNEMFIVKEGAVKTTIKLPDGNQRDLSTFKNGDFFGEMSIFDHAPRSATCRTVEKSTLIGLKEDDLFAMIDRNPEITIKIMYRMLNITTQRLRGTGEFLSDMVQWGEAARRRTITDEFTGAYNRRFLDDNLPEYFESSRKKKESLSLLMVDLDYFRDINEHYGHDMGDRVILEVVSVIKQHLGDSDILARYGGDEFIVLLPGRGLEESFDVAEKIRADVEKIDILKDTEARIRKVSTSQGLASFPENAGSMEDLKEKADQALYKAKEAGRNRVAFIANNDLKDSK